MPHVQHDHFGSFNQSHFCFLALSLPQPSSFLKLPNYRVIITSSSTNQRRAFSIITYVIILIEYYRLKVEKVSCCTSGMLSFSVRQRAEVKCWRTWSTIIVALQLQQLPSLLKLPYETNYRFRIALVTVKCRLQTRGKMQSKVIK